MARKLVFDRLLFATVLVLSLLGLVMVSSATAPMVRSSETGFFLANPLLIKQCVAGVIGLLGMLVVMHIDYRVLKRPSVIYTGLVGVAVLLVAVLFTGEINGSRRWIRLAGLSFQP
ncbi:MAG: FtsW/RodA/SpoVE family cell cycle protein, partial [Acidobacteriota bacterium]